jgi:hypothetical protein
MTTDEALAQVYPRIPRLQTILASLCAWGDIAYLVEMCAGCHGAILLIYKMIVYSHRDNTSNANTLTIHYREGLCHWLNDLKPSCSFLQVAELPIRVSPSGREGKREEHVGKLIQTTGEDEHAHQNQDRASYEREGTCVATEVAHEHADAIHQKAD